MNLKTNRELIIILIFFIAFTPRAIYLGEVVKTPFYDSPVIDAKFFNDWAASIPHNPLGTGVYEKAPLYAYILSIVYMLPGPDPFTARALNIILSSLACVLLYLIGEKLFNQKSALLAALSFSLYWPSIYLDGELLRVSLQVFLILAAVYSLLFYTKSRRQWMASGVITGLACITNPMALLLAPFIIAWVFKTSPKKARDKSKAILVGMLIVIAPVTLRNVLVGGEFFIISSNAGVNFFIGNNPDYEHTTTIGPGVYWDMLMDEPASFGASTLSRINDYWYQKSLGFVWNDPAGFGGLLLKKLFIFFSGGEVGRNVDLDYARSMSKFLGRQFLGYWLIAPFALTGILLSIKDVKLRKKHLLLHFYVLAILLANIIFFVNTRYRMPVVPVFGLFAGFAVTEITTRIRRRKKYFTPLLLLVLFYGLVNSGLIDHTKLEARRYHYNLGISYLEKGNTRQAIAEFEKHRNNAPDDVDAYLKLGKIYVDENKLDKAVGAYEAAVKIDPSLALSHYNLATVYLLNKYYDNAVVEYEKTLILNPGYFDAWINLGNVYATLGDTDKAFSAYRNASVINDESSMLFNNMGNIYFMINETVTAGNFYYAAIKRDSKNSEAYNNMGNVFVRLENYTRALQMYDLALGINPEHKLAKRNRARAEKLLRNASTLII